MIEKIKAFISDWELFSYEDKICVAFSGGADSVMLLDFVCGEYKNVCAVHINHMIRGDEAERDEEFARAFCKEKNIELFVQKIDVPNLKNKGEGLEEAARRLRYGALEKIAAEEKIDVILTAHHADDNAETVLFNLVRGSGGLRGVPASRGKYKRPLLCVAKEEILCYCKEKNLNFVTDSTNADTEYKRNFIRHNIMPKIKEINPQATDALLRACIIAQKEDEYLDSSAKKALTKGRCELASEDEVIISRAVRLLLKENNIDVGYQTTKIICDCIKDGKNYHSAEIGNNLFFVCDRDTFFIRKSEEKTEDFILDLSCGVYHFYNAEIFCTDDKNSADKWLEKHKNSEHIFLCRDKIAGGISVRSKKDGDRYNCCGITHKVKKLFCEKNIPVEKRKEIPLFCDRESIIWIPGFAPNSKFTKPNFSTDKILFLGIQY